MGSGRKRDAILAAVGEDSTHGKRCTRANVHRAVEILLLNREWETWSDRQIADRVQVDHKTVGARRRRLLAAGLIRDDEPRLGADGRLYAVSSPGADVADDASNEVEPAAEDEVTREASLVVPLCEPDAQDPDTEEAALPVAATGDATGAPSLQAAAATTRKQPNAAAAKKRSSADAERNNGEVKDDPIEHLLVGLDEGAPKNLKVKSEALIAQIPAMTTTHWQMPSTCWRPLKVWRGTPW